MQYEANDIGNKVSKSGVGAMKTLEVMIGNVGLLETAGRPDSHRGGVARVLCSLVRAEFRSLNAPEITLPRYRTKANDVDNKVSKFGVGATKTLGVRP